MTTISSSTSFYSPSSPGDAIAVLVLVDTSASMINCWDDVKKNYLPPLLDTLRLNNPRVSMRICWQLTTETHTNQSPSGALPSNSGNSNEIPDITIDPNSCNVLSTGSLRYSIETLKAAFRERNATRHLFVVAAALPAKNLKSSPTSMNSYESWQAIAITLGQEKIRLHLILGTSHNTQPLRDLHEQLVQLQNSLVVPAWFNVDSSKFAVFLSGRPYSANVQASEPGSSTRSMFPSTQSSPVTPTITSSSLPSSPVYDGPHMDHHLQLSPSNRRGKHRASAPISPGATAGPPTHGLVSYLQQMHGLTKKRSYGQKVPKRASSGDAPRQAASSRPILPRLDLPDSRLRGWSPYPTTSPPNRAIIEKAAANASRYTAIAPAPPDGTAGADESRRPRSRWPWLQPTPSSSTSSQRSVPLTSNTALQSLASMTPRHPDLTTRIADEAAMRPPGASRVSLSAMSTSSPSPELSTHVVAQPPEWPIIRLSHNSIDAPMSSTPSPTITTSHVRGSWGSPTLPSQYHAQSLHSPPSMPYSRASHDMVHSPLTSPTLQLEDPNDPENQPFVITPEYEAMANAQFEAAVRSGAMQASMTATTLSPIAASPLSTTSSDYFGGAPLPNGPRSALPSPHQPTMPTAPPQHPQYSHMNPYSNPTGSSFHKVTTYDQLHDNSPIRRSYDWYGST